MQVFTSAEKLQRNKNELSLESKLAFSEWAERPKIKINPQAKEGFMLTFVGLVKDLQKAVEQNSYRNID